jgi:hypothetical protein
MTLENNANSKDLSKHRLFDHIDEHEEKDRPRDPAELVAAIQEFEVDAYQWCQEKSKIIPDFIPVLSPLIQCGLSEFKGALAAQGIDGNTGEVIEGGITERVVASLKIKLESLYHQVELAIDTIAIVGTAGVGAPTEIAAKDLLKRVGEVWLKETGKKIAMHAVDGRNENSAKTETEDQAQQVEKYTDLLGNPDLEKLAQIAEEIADRENPQAARSLLVLLQRAILNSGAISEDKLDRPEVGEVGTEMATVFLKLINNPTISGFMEETLKNFSGWEDMQAKIGQLGTLANELNQNQREAMPA